MQFIWPIRAMCRITAYGNISVDYAMIVFYLLRIVKESEWLLKYAISSFEAFI